MEQNKFRAIALVSIVLMLALSSVTAAYSNPKQGDGQWVNRTRIKHIVNIGFVAFSSHDLKT